MQHYVIAKALGNDFRGSHELAGTTTPLQQAHIALQLLVKPLYITERVPVWCQEPLSGSSISTHNAGRPLPSLAFPLDQKLLTLALIFIYAR